MSRKRKRRMSEADEVKLNMTAMLDMAFQLLAFFVLTFRTAPVEGQISLRMPDPAPIAPSKGEKVGGTDSKKPLESMKQLVITLWPDKVGGIESIYVGETPVATDGTPEEKKLPQLFAKLNSIFRDPAGSPFEQVVLQIGSDVFYQKVMDVVDGCTHLKLANGQPLTKLTFVELPTGPHKDKDAPKKK